ncbi:hypothetical protein EAT51_09585 [Pseudoxanthomonas winnipegensis]|uniref:hypothetical protein n=1 Tax=Pseudoxanthomonas winnipegensis TaxID=2480810 RepID=UPI00102D723E|nr:hypothetical protein [Pseudoxanthomonas winnipegensis]TAA41309.1 hypothetical protein EAT51_09585 [Pseudoxanthomonas winnipegensis]
MIHARRPGAGVARKTNAASWTRRFFMGPFRRHRGVMFVSSRRSPASTWQAIGMRATPRAWKKFAQLAREAACATRKRMPRAPSESGAIQLRDTFDATIGTRVRAHASAVASRATRAANCIKKALCSTCVVARASPRHRLERYRLGSPARQGDDALQNT